MVAVEQQLHDSLLADLGIDPGVADGAEIAPTTLAYTSYLLATARGGSYAEGVGAVLPCYWIYWEVGKELRRRGSPDPRFQRWIDTYGGEDYGDVRPGGPGRHQRRLRTCPPPSGADALALPGDEPVRVDVLGHGPPDGALADFPVTAPCGINAQQWTITATRR